MLQIRRTNSENTDFIELVKQLDVYLSKMDGTDHSFYDQFNKIDEIRHVVIAYKNEEAVGCGAIKGYDSQNMEVKRMYTHPSARGKGVAGEILNELEKWAAELFYKKCILETGKKQVEAIGLYKKNGYCAIPNYGQYAGVGNSVCFEKKLS